MKYDLSPILESKLKEIYGLSNENSNYLYRYLYIRTAIMNNQRKLKQRQIFKFAIEELNLTVFKENTDSYLKYEDMKYDLFYVQTDFLDNLEFQADMEGSLDFKEELEEIFVKGYRKAQKYKKSPNYTKHLALERLKELNSEFGAYPESSEGIEGFEVDLLHNPFKRTIEEKLTSEIETSKNDNSTSYLKEKDLEDYLVGNLQVIEEGLQFIKRQVEVPGGVIDILAKDKDGNLCILELKIKDDKNLIWQSIHYPMSIKNVYNVGLVRMMTIAPEYSKSVYDSLQTVQNVECFKYELNVNSGEITDLKMIKL